MEAQVQFLSTIKSFFTKYVLPVIYVLIALVGLNALNPWVTSFIRDWHRSYPGSCMYPNYYARPGGMAQTGSESGQQGTWLDAVREQGVDLSQEEAEEMENLLVELLKEHSGSGEPLPPLAL